MKTRMVTLYYDDFNGEALLKGIWDELCEIASVKIYNKEEDREVIGVRLNISIPEVAEEESDDELTLPEINKEE